MRKTVLTVSALPKISFSKPEVWWAERYPADKTRWVAGNDSAQHSQQSTRGIIGDHPCKRPDRALLALRVHAVSAFESNRNTFPAGNQHSQASCTGCASSRYFSAFTIHLFWMACTQKKWDGQSWRLGLPLIEICDPSWEIQPTDGRPQLHCPMMA